MKNKDMIKYILEFYGTETFTVPDFSSRLFFNKDIYCKESIIRNKIQQFYNDGILYRLSTGKYCLAIGTPPAQTTEFLPKAHSVLKKIHEKHTNLPKDNNLYAVFILPDHHHIMYMNSAITKNCTVKLSLGGKCYEVDIVKPLVKVNIANRISVALIELTLYVDRKNINFYRDQFWTCFSTFWEEIRRIRHKGTAILKPELVDYLRDQAQTLREVYFMKDLEKQLHKLFESGEEILKGNYDTIRDYIKFTLIEEAKTYSETSPLYIHYRYDILALRRVIINSYYKTEEDKIYLKKAFKHSTLSYLFPPDIYSDDLPFDETVTPMENKILVFHRSERI